MKYCMRYSRTFRYLDEIDELNIDFKRSDAGLPNFLDKYKDKTINISLTGEYEDKDVELLINLYRKYGNLKVKLPMKDIDSIEKLRRCGVPFFFTDTFDDWDKLNEAFALEPTDVYIVNYLGFCLKNVAEMAHSRGIDVRVVPNLAQSRWRNQLGLRKFFIRPEDTSIYEQYVDVFEIFAESGRESVYYDIYANMGYWFGDLNEIIYNLVDSIDSRCLLPNWGKYRLNCGKECIKDGNCEICDKLLTLSEALKEKNLIITQK